MMAANEVLCPDKDLADVQKELNGTASKWKTIGIQLKLPLSSLEKIEEEHRGNAEGCNLAMQILWLKSKRATWKSLVEALKKSSDQLEEKARTIENKKITHSMMNIIMHACNS